MFTADSQEVSELRVMIQETNVQFNSQNEQRDLVQMPHMAWAGYFGALAIGAVIGGVLLLIGRLIGQGLVAFDRMLAALWGADEPPGSPGA